MIHRSSVIAIWIVVLMPVLVAAQVPWPPASLEPAVPTSADVLQATFSIPSCTPVSTTTINGSVVRTTTVLQSCIFTNPFQNIEVHTFGPLPPGNYTYEIYFVYYPGTDPPVLRSTQAFAVGEAPAVPLTTPLGSVLLAAALVAASMFAITRA